MRYLFPKVCFINFSSAGIHKKLIARKNKKGKRSPVKLPNSSDIPVKKIKPPKYIGFLEYLNNPLITNTDGTSRLNVVLLL